MSGNFLNGTSQTPLSDLSGGKVKIKKLNMQNGDTGAITKADLSAAIRELKEYVDGLIRASDTSIREYIDERTHDAETRLLRGFADYNAAVNVRFRKLEADTSNIDTSTTQRLGEIERQLAEFQARIIVLESKRPQ
jgi:recombinational DNA repair ATPase RecF